MGNCLGDSRDRDVTNELVDARMKQAKDHKLLLLGSGNSGKSTFFKQLCQIHGNGFQRQDIEQARQNVHDCVIDQMKQLIEICQEKIKRQQDDEQNANDNDKLNDDDSKYEYSLSGKAKEAADYMMSHKVPRGGTDLTPEVAAAITTLWNDESIKHAFHTRPNLGVVDSAPHFFQDMDRLSDINYTPTDQDILLTRIPTTGMKEESFSVENNQFTIVDVGGQRSERSKWINQFNIVDAVLFVASLSCYDQNLYEEEYVNAMHESLRLFEIVVNNRYFRKSAIILFLNKRDLFRDKIAKKSITCCFKDYEGKENDYDEAVAYITEMYESCATDPTRRIYAHVTCATDVNNVKHVFHDVQHSILLNTLQRHEL